MRSTLEQINVGFVASPPCHAELIMLAAQVFMVKDRVE